MKHVENNKMKILLILQTLVMAPIEIRDLNFKFHKVRVLVMKFWKYRIILNCRKCHRTKNCQK